MRVRVFYLATSAAIYVPICEHLKQLGLTQGEVRVVVEKPIGSDSATAAAINNAVGLSFDEGQTYRIDHYLGKETVQNLLALRFGNALFEPLWSAEHIDHVQITVAETVGVESARVVLRECRRAARHDPEPHAAAVVHGGDGTARVARSRRDPRRETESAALARADQREQRGSSHRARTISRRRDAERPRAGISRRIETQGHANRHVRRAQSRKSKTGAGPACRFICARASVWPNAFRKS